MNTPSSKSKHPMQQGHEPWVYSEAIMLRSAGFIQLMLMGCALILPSAVFGPFGFSYVEPATFYRFSMLAYGALGLALLRVVRMPRSNGIVLVETIGLIKISFFIVVFIDTLARRLPSHAPLATVVELMFGAALFRIARRKT
jgi:hypothetical protein